MIKEFLHVVKMRFVKLIFFSVYGSHPEKAVTKRILQHYENTGLHGRPVTNTSASLPVSIRFSLIQVLEIDPELQIFDFVGMVYLVS